MRFAYCSLSFLVPKQDHYTLTNEHGQYRMEHWARDVESALKTLPTVEDIEMGVPTGSTGFEPGDLLQRWGLDQDINRVPHTYGRFAPHPSNGYVKFKVRINQAARERVFPMGGAQSDVFSVYVNYSFGFPTAIINGEKPEDASGDIVPIVREFLKDEFRQRAENLNGVEIAFLPPAPMWLDGQVIHDESLVSGEHRVDVIPSRGYDILQISLPKNSSQIQAGPIATELLEQVALYYQTVAMGNYYGDVELSLDVFAKDLIANYRNPGARAAIRRLTSGFRSAADLQIMAVEASIDKRSGIERLESSLADLERRVGQLALRPWIDMALRDLRTSSAPEVERISTYVSDGTGHSIQTVAVVAAAVLGGAAGATLTALLT